MKTKTPITKGKRDLEKAIKLILSAMKVEVPAEQRKIRSYLVVGASQIIAAKRLFRESRLLVVAASLLTLTGCAPQHFAQPAISSKTPDINPLHANVGSQMLRASPNTSAADTVVALPPQTITISWSSKMPGDYITTGLQTSPDLINWITLCETNPFEDCTNYFTFPKSIGNQFYRTFNRSN